MKTFKDAFLASVGTFMGMAVGLVAGAALLEKFGPKKKEEAKAEVKDDEFGDEWVK